MPILWLFLSLCVFYIRGNVPEDFYQENRVLAKAILESLQDSNFDNEIVFDLKKENQIYLNRTMSLIIKYIVKREVDNYRSRRTDAISRRIYSSLVMKLIDIAKDMDRNASATVRIETAHRYYTAVESNDMHDAMADLQVFHVCARLYDVMINAPRVIDALGNLDDMTPRTLVRKLYRIDMKPIHFAITLLIQFHLRSAVNYIISSDALETLSTRPAAVGPRVVETLKALAAKLLPVSELLDVHLSHSSKIFKDTCPNSWLGIVKNK